MENLDNVTLVTVHTEESYTSEEFEELVNADWFMHIDLHTKLLFLADLWLLDKQAGHYNIVKKFGSV